MLNWASQVVLVVKKPPATPVFSPGESYGQRSLVGYSPRSHEESDTTEAA